MAPTDLTDEQLNAILGTPGAQPTSQAVASSAAGPVDQYGTPIADSAGLPISDSSAPAPSNIDMADPDTQPHPAGFLGSIENFGSSAAKTVWGGVKTVGSDVASGISNTENAVLKPVEGAGAALTMNIVLILAVVGVALVLVFRTGNVKANIIA